MTNRKKSKPIIMNRRRFVSAAGAVAMVPGMLGHAVTAFGATGLGTIKPIQGLQDNRVLVVVQLEGGNDGLNTVIPYGDDAYYRQRPNIALAAEQLHKLDERMALHPELVELKRLYDDGHLAIVQNVGYPEQNRSHFTSTDIWNKAAWFDPTQPAEVLDGWLGRYFARCCARVESSMLGLQVGSRATPAFASDAPRAVAIENPAIMEWPEYQAGLRSLQHATATGGTDDFDYVRHISRQTLSLAERIQAAQQIQPRTEYPPFHLCQSLRLIGQMIAAQLPTRVFFVSISGFDTHNDQQRRQRGLLQEVSQAIGAFARDMQTAGQWERILVMTYSEFGRRVAENGTLGTDHGAASMMFAAGGAVTPGLHGEHPDLGTLEGDDLPFKIDFRSVYAGVLKHWFGVEPEPVLLGRFDALPIVRPA